MKLHERIRLYINDNGLKIKYIAKKSEIDLGRFYRIIAGDSIMSADEFERICKALDIDPKYFFNQKFLITKNNTA